MSDYLMIANGILNGTITEFNSNQIVEILMEADDQYHNDGESFLTDSEYDSLVLILKKINPNDPYLSKVGSDVRGGKVDLPYPMGSLDQVYEGDTVKWVKELKAKDEDFVITDKQDGTSCLIIYGKNGKLSIAYSRGNGFQGADITRHIRNIPSVPLKVSKPCAIRGEVIMEDSVFEQFQQEMISSKQRVYKNPRNYVAGRMNASENTSKFYDAVKFIGTSVVDPKMGKLEQMKFMEDNGFIVTPYTVMKGKELMDDHLIKYLNERRAASKTAIDGIVIDIDKAEIRASLRRKSSSLNPMYSRKFKIGSEDNVTIAEVVKVHWNPSKAGYLKPRVEIKPVDLVGVTITYATGFNAKFIKDNIIGPGAKVQITRSGDVIPFIQKVVSASPSGPDLPMEHEFGELDWNDTGVDLILVNADENETVIINRLIDMFTALEVPHLKEGSIQKLFNAGYKTPESIIKASEDELKSILGDSAGSKIFNGLRSKLNGIPLGILAGASQLLGRGIGRRKMTKLIEVLGEEYFLGNNIHVKDIVKVEGFEEKTAEVIVSNIGNFQNFLKSIDGYYTLKKKEVNVDGDLVGTVVVFTGIRDKDLEAKIEARGGTIGSSVSKNTTHLVAKDPTSGSSKLKRAADMGVKIISIVEAKELWG